MQIIWPKINYLVSSIQLQPWYLRGGSIESSSGLSSAQTLGNASLDAATTLGGLSSGGLISTGAPINSTVGRSASSRCTPPCAALTSTGTVSAECTPNHFCTRSHQWRHCPLFCADVWGSAPINAVTMLAASS